MNKSAEWSLLCSWGCVSGVMASPSSPSKKAEPSLQKAFEADVRKIKTDGAKLNLVNQASKQWNYGKDSHKGCNIGKTKSLPRTCSGMIRKHLSPKWIPKDCQLEYCVFSKGNNGCCMNPDDYIFGDALNLRWLIQKRFGLNKLDSQDQERAIRAFMRDLIDEKTENCTLDIILDMFVSKFYIKRVKQDRLSKSMDIQGVLCVYAIYNFSKKVRLNLTKCNIIYLYTE